MIIMTATGDVMFDVLCTVYTLTQGLTCYKRDIKLRDKFHVFNVTLNTIKF